MSDAALSTSHDPFLVALSVSIAVVASFCALDLSGRMRAASGWVSLAWLAAAAVAMGGGIWSMHFVAMLAFKLPFPAAYDPGLTALSLVIPILVTGLGFGVVRRRGGGAGRDIILGGFVMGSGIAAMHYIGMAAIHVPARMHHQAPLVFVSVLIAIGASMVALWLSMKDASVPARASASVAMGLAVAGMHYTAMLATSWSEQGDSAAFHARGGITGLEQTSLALAVATATFVILSTALVATLLDRRFAAVAQREAELALRQSEARTATLAAEHSAILSQLAEGVIVTDVGGRITYLNEAAVRMHGGEMQLGVGPAAYSVTYRLYTADGEPYPSEMLPLARAVLHGETVTEARWRIRWPDGAEVVAVGSAQPLRGLGGVQVGAVLTLRDETSRAVAEAALRDNEARLRVALAAAGLGTWEVDLTTGRMVWDAPLAALLGVSPDRAEEAAASWWDVIHPEDQKRVLQAFDTSAEGGAPYNEEFRIRRPDGTERVVVLQGILSAPGRMVGIMQDVTDARAAEAVLARDMVEMERLVEARTAALVRAAEERRRAEEAVRQSEKLAALGQLTGGIAHDFNNLLQVVTSGAALLKRPTLPETRRQMILDGMIQAGRNARDLTSRLLAFARRQSLRPEVVDVETRLAGMSNLLRQTLGSRIRVETEFEADLWQVRVDPSQLEVAILNLAVNGRDAMPDGGVLTIQARNAVLGATADRVAGEYVCIAIRDTGTGMPAHLLTHVLEPFFTTKMPGQGTGLGLSQVHGFVQQSGGDLRIESELGHGTVVFFHLPRATDAPVGDGTPAASTPDFMQGVGKTVLVVEDNPEVAAFACSLLEELGYLTRHAGNAAEALKDLEDGEPVDLVFSDVMMPGDMNGVDLAVALGRSRPSLPVILTTGYHEQIARFASPPGVEMLYKPYHPDELAAALARALARCEALKPATGKPC